MCKIGAETVEVGAETIEFGAEMVKSGAEMDSSFSSSRKCGLHGVPKLTKLKCRKKCRNRWQRRKTSQSQVIIYIVQRRGLSKIILTICMFLLFVAVILRLLSK
jgi:hypothetical protein